MDRVKSVAILASRLYTVLMINDYTTVRETKHIKEFVEALQYIIDMLEKIESSIVLGRHKEDEHTILELNDSVASLSSNLIARGILAMPLPLRYDITTRSGIFKKNSDVREYLTFFSFRLRRVGIMLFDVSSFYGLNINTVAEILTLEDESKIALYLISPVLGERVLAQKTLEKFSEP